MENNSPLGADYVHQPHTWEDWWSANHSIPLGTPGDGSRMTNCAYTHANPLYESSVYNYDANSMNPTLDSTYSWNGFDFTTEYASPLLTPTHIVTKELPAPQAHSYLPLAAEYPNQQQNHDPEDLSICKPARRRYFIHENLNPGPKNKRQSTPCRTRSDSSSGSHSTQQSSDRVKKVQEQNRIRASKSRIQQREEVSSLMSRTQELARIRRELSTCVTDLSLEEAPKSRLHNDV
ncbi:hypothetical protein FOQG_17812 [Fusarium oxysporum f. sp. raphani 54005]|uniref:BZIP domain-containing protein n=2 Tax=Fusarium oxysporum f. sp. raphani TaxID=96318 RepID=X0BF63_FUSOX|nr:hypothetical protein FOQG_17812 [Fusarium oxysporum f. sp. raphani 54005]KAG7413384.1 hypothetical protein Forpi1262_v017033 [Fusarium oxysporum f. sp. raphani]